MKAALKMPPLITLTTDFGSRDHFVAVMKGVIAGIAPAARVVDVTHEITPFEVVEGAYTLAQAAAFFPAGTIHVAVVDPGVGSARRGLLVEADGQFYVGPDNGLLSLVALQGKKVKVRQLEAARYWLKPVSATFHGRDVFAPVAAHLAAGVAAAKFGKLVGDWQKPGSLAPHRTGSRIWMGTILKVDRFGNIITNFRPADFPEMQTRHWHFAVGMEQLDKRIEHYSQLATGEVGIIVGSSGYLEVIANQSDAARKLGVVAGAPVELVFART